MEKYLNSKYSLEERRKYFQEHINKFMNPILEKDFDPETFDPFKGTPEYELGKRQRILPSKKLPTCNMKPKEIRGGQMIGMFESKQDLYLIFAHRCNELQEEVDELKKKIEDLEKKT